MHTESHVQFQDVPLWKVGVESKVHCHRCSCPNSTHVQANAEYLEPYTFPGCPHIYKSSNLSMGISVNISSILCKSLQATVEYTNVLNLEMEPLEFAKCFSCDLKELI